MPGGVHANIESKGVILPLNQDLPISKSVVLCAASNMGTIM